MLEVFGTVTLVLGTEADVVGTLTLVLGTWTEVVGTVTLVLGTDTVVVGTTTLVLGTETDVVAGTGTLEKVAGQFGGLPAGKVPYTESLLPAPHISLAFPGHGKLQSASVALTLGQSSVLPQ